MSYFPHLSNTTLVLGAQKNRLNETTPFGHSKQTYIEGAQKNRPNETPPPNTQNTSLH